MPKKKNGNEALPAPNGGNETKNRKNPGARRASNATPAEKELINRIKRLSSNPFAENASGKDEKKGRAEKKPEPVAEALPEREKKPKPPRRTETPAKGKKEAPARAEAPAGQQDKRRRQKGGKAELDRIAEEIVRDEEKKPREKVKAPAHKRGGTKLRIIPLGGIGEIGKNLTVIEYGDDMILVDCGLGFPDEDMPGVDLVIPDTEYLEENRHKLRGLLLTHGHEDHVGAVPYLLKTFNIPVYGTKLTLKIVENKLKEFRLPWDANLRCVAAGDTVRLGCFSAEFIRVNHSIADACCLAIRTPLGMVIHTGDFKLDLTPIEGEIMNIPRLGELGNQGVLLLLCESTNAERTGYTPSERTVGRSLEYIFTTHPDKRLVVSTFSSNVHRVQQIIDASVRHGRKVVLFGRSIVNIITSAIELGYINLPDGVLIDVGDMRRYRPSELTVVCTGSQGEPMSALYRMAFGDKTQITLDRNDVVVISASAIPGNEKLVGRIVNELCRRGIDVMNDPSVGVHVSGHACAEELKLMQALTKPKYFMPVHGEYRHLEANRRLALEMGMDDGNIFVSRIGQVLELDRRGARFAGSVPSGNVLVDGSGVGEVGEIVLRDRRLLAQDGLIVVVATLDDENMMTSRPDVISRGFVYMRESEELIEQVRDFSAELLDKCLRRDPDADRVQLKTRLRDELSRFIYQKTRRRPMVLPVIMKA